MRSILAPVIAVLVSASLACGSRTGLDLSPPSPGGRSPSGGSASPDGGGVASSGAPGQDASTPGSGSIRAVQASGPHPIALAADGSTTCALVSDGSVRCWGDGAGGQLGNGRLGGSYAPVSVDSLDGATGVAVGDNFACALRTDATVWCWGTLPGLGPVSGGAPYYATKTDGLTSAVAIAAGGLHVCALLAGGSVACWGENTQGEAGEPTDVPKAAPVTIAHLPSATALAAGDQDTCALLTTGGVACWGAGSQGQLGDGLHTLSAEPVFVAGLVDATALSVGFSTACALRAGGAMACWGNDAADQIGADTSGEPKVCPFGACATTPIAVTALGARDALVVSAGFHDTCAVLGDGTIACWGANDSGQLGDGTTNAPSTCGALPCTATAVTVQGVTDAVSVVTGIAHACALLADASIVCWGENRSGQLGDESIEASATPVKVQW